MHVYLWDGTENLVESRYMHEASSSVGRGLSNPSQLGLAHDLQQSTYAHVKLGGRSIVVLIDACEARALTFIANARYGGSPTHRSQRCTVPKAPLPLVARKVNLH
jgi:hypothetical protein